jgi:hypothetical protein
MSQYATSATEMARSQDEAWPSWLRSAESSALLFFASRESREALTKLHPPRLDDVSDISIAMSQDISRDISKAVQKELNR